MTNDSALTASTPTLLLQIMKSAFKFKAPMQTYNNVKNIFLRKNILSNSFRLIISLGGLGGGIALPLCNAAVNASVANVISGIGLLFGIPLPPFLLSVIVCGTSGLLGNTAGQIASKIIVGIVTLIRHGCIDPAFYSDPEKVIQALIANGTISENEAQYIENLRNLVKKIPFWSKKYDIHSFEYQKMKSAAKDLNEGSLDGLREFFEMKAAQLKCQKEALGDSCDTTDYGTSSYSPRYQNERLAKKIRKGYLTSSTNIDEILTDEQNTVEQMKEVVSRPRPGLRSSAF